MSTIVSGAGRGCQPSIFVDFAVETSFGSPRSPASASSDGTSRAAVAQPRSQDVGDLRQRQRLAGRGQEALASAGLALSSIWMMPMELA